MYCINRKSALMIRALFLSLWRETCEFSFIHSPSTHDNTPDKPYPSCPHRDAYLQQADTSEDPAIWTQGSRMLFIFIHLQKNQRRRLLCLILIPLYSSLSVFSLTFHLLSRSEEQSSNTQRLINTALPWCMAHNVTGDLVRPVHQGNKSKCDS